MIFDPHASGSPASSGLVSHIGEQILSVCEGTESAFDVHEVARAIELFLEERQCDVIDSKTLAFLAAQAMSSVGETDVARRLVVLGCGLVRPSEWMVTGDREIWVLDLREMTVRDHTPLELALFQGVQIVIESIAEVWDASDGDGVLGLRHICSAASDLLRAPERKGPVTQLGLEIKELCVRKLEQLRVARGWTSTPRVLNLDF